jgi:hypothetical protein
MEITRPVAREGLLTSRLSEVEHQLAIQLWTLSVKKEVWLVEVWYVLDVPTVISLKLTHVLIKAPLILSPRTFRTAQWGWGLILPLKNVLSVLLITSYNLMVLVQVVRVPVLTDQSIIVTSVLTKQLNTLTVELDSAPIE